MAFIEGNNQEEQNQLGMVGDPNQGVIQSQPQQTQQSQPMQQQQSGVLGGGGKTGMSLPRS